MTKTVIVIDPQLQHILNLSPYLLLIAIFLIFLTIAYLIFRHIYLKNIYINRQYTYLELTPPQDTLQSPLSTRELLTFIHNYATPYRNWKKYIFLVPKNIYSFEIIATKDKGIRYILRVPKEDQKAIKKSLYSHISNIRINNIKDTIETSSLKENLNIFEMILGNHYVFPLLNQTQLPQHDPIAFITGNMTKLEKDESIIMQLLVSPIDKQTHPLIAFVSKRILHHAYSENKIPQESLSGHMVSNYSLLNMIPFLLIKEILYYTFKIILFPLKIISVLISPDASSKYGVFSHKKEENESRKLLYKDIKEKFGQELYEINCRFVVSTSSDDLNSRSKGLVSSLATFTNSPYQCFSIKPKTLWKSLSKEVDLFRLKNRLFSIYKNPILSVTETSSIFHLPFTNTTKTEDMIKSKTNYLPLDIKLKNETNCDVVFAKNNHDGKAYEIGLTREERMRHTYIIGSTGTGKTTLLMNMIMDDINNNKGICVIDPHGDLTDEIISRIPESRIKDTVYFNPEDTAYPSGLNFLELPKDLEDDQLQKEKDLIASSMISLFSKLYPPRYTGPRMENILRNTVLTALETTNPTLFTIQQLLVDTKYRKKIVEQIKDPVLKLFWTKEFQHLGSYQKAEAVSPITNKIGRFITSPHTRYILGQAHSTIDFDDIMNNHKILLCDLSKGKIGEDISTLFGGIITAKIQLAALRRVNTKEKNRKDFYLYIDEFQNFATTSFAQILSEARKYRLGAILAHQTTAQIEDKDLLKVILANTGTTISFRTGNPSDELLLLKYFTPAVEKGELTNLPNYNFFMKINAITPTNTFSGEVERYTKTESSDKVKKDIIEYSRNNYAHKKEEVKQEMENGLLDTKVENKKRTSISDKSSALPD